MRFRALLFAMSIAMHVGIPSLKADGVIRDGVGARSVGRGGTNLAFADNGQVLLDNPAGIVNICSESLCEVGIDILFTDLQYADADNRVTNADDNPFPMGQVSVIRRDPDGLAAWGIGFFSQAGFSAEYHLNGPFPFSGTRHYKSLGSLLRIQPGAAVRLTDSLSCGGTLGVAVSHAEVEAPYTLQRPGPLQGTPTLLDMQGTGAALSWSWGIQYELSPRTTLGLAYQNETRFQLDGNARITVPFLGSTLFDTEWDFVWPRSLGCGVQHRLCPHRTLSADLVWYDWSHAFDRFDLKFRQPTNPLIGAVTGPLLLESFPLDWHDTLSVRLGYSRRWGTRLASLGYTYHRNPIPDATLSPFIQGILQHGFHLGYGWQRSGVEIDTAYQFSFGSNRRVVASDIVGGDFDDASHHAQVHWFLISFRGR